MINIGQIALPNETFDDEISEMLDKLFNIDDSIIEERPKDMKLKMENNSISHFQYSGGGNLLFGESQLNGMSFDTSYRVNSHEKPKNQKKFKEQVLRNKLIKLDYNKIFKNDEFVNRGISDEFLTTFNGKLTILLKNYNGSILLQKFLPNTHDDIISKLFFEITKDLSDLMVDPYGNYFCQILYKKLKKSEKLTFLKEIRTDFILISSNTYGNYALQTVIENLLFEEEIDILLSILAFDNNLVKMIKNNNSIHVIEKIIIILPEHKIDFIYLFTIKNFLNLSIDKLGLFIVKKIIINCKSPVYLIQLRNLLIEHFFVLVINPIGNHVIQTALEVI